MKNILNNLSEEEKNSIREQHTGGMKVMTENFSRLLKSKLGNSKPLVESEEIPEQFHKKGLSKLATFKRDLDKIFSQKVSSPTTTDVHGEWNYDEREKSYEETFNEMEELINRYRAKESEREQTDNKYEDR
jgi:hypothetical protein